MSEKRVPPYPDPVQERQELLLRTYEYLMPFNYPNVSVERDYNGPEFHGVEMFPIPEVNAENPSISKPAEGIVVVEDDPIVRVVVVGSACTPPGYVTLEAEPCEGFRRPDEMVEVMPVRMRSENLWGMHLRYDQWAEEHGGRPFPESAPAWLKDRGRTVYRCITAEFPLAGMSCAVFEIPGSRKVRISGGCAVAGWTGDAAPSDNHYSFRVIRTTVAASARAEG